MHRVTLAGAIAPLLLVGSAAAGDWHTGTTLLCGNCHIMHYSESHGPVGTTPGPSPTQPGLMGGPNHYLLRAPVNDLCLSCHDGGIAADVLGANSGSDVRLAGRLNRGVIGHPESGHTLDSTAVAPGSEPAWSNPDGLNCTDCHHQHGYGGPGGISTYRNLVYNPGDTAFPGIQVTYETSGVGGVTTPTNTVDVYLRDSLSYDESDVDWQEPDTTKSKIAMWCGGCHDNFHGDPGVPTGGGGGVGGVASGTSWEEFERHPVSAVNIGALGGGHSSLAQYEARANKVKVMSSLGNWSVAPLGNDLTPTCISCHKAHGNQNDYGLIFRSGSGTLTEEGDTGAAGANPPFGQLEHLCGQCHVQASAFSL